MATIKPAVVNQPWTQAGTNKVDPMAGKDMQPLSNGEQLAAIAAA
jgi:hypothetical protein